MALTFLQLMTECRFKPRVRKCMLMLNCSAKTGLIGAFALTIQVCVTGEITLRGALNAVGDIPVKMSGKARSWVDTIIIPRDNAEEAKEVPRSVPGAGLRLHYVPVDDMQGVLRQVIQPEGKMRGKGG